MFKPILFKDEMVRAIIKGSKTQTRRIVKIKKEIPPPGDIQSAAWNEFVFTEEQEILGFPVIHRFNCPFGIVGDFLWVRETWAPDPNNETDVIYRADSWDEWFDNIRWKPNMFMKRIHSRITLEITGIGVERLRDISNNDAWCEGVSDSPEYNCRALFFDLWEKINGEKEGCSVNDNPWVWRIEFVRILK